MTDKSGFYKSIISVFIFLLALLVGGAAVYSDNNAEERRQKTAVLGTQGEEYRVLEIIDGDTIKIEYNGTGAKARLLGIDTPETNKPNSPVECFGKEATEKTRELLQGKEVKIEFDQSQGTEDRYGRLLLYVWRVEDNLFINEYLLSEGYAFEYTYDLPYKYQNQFKQQENLARENKKGLWGDVCK